MSPRRRFMLVLLFVLMPVACSTPPPVVPTATVAPVAEVAPSPTAIMPTDSPAPTATQESTPTAEIEASTPPAEVTLTAEPMSTVAPVATTTPVSSTFPSVFGAEIAPTTLRRIVPQTLEANLSWIRYNGILWSTVEATQSQRDWSKLKDVDVELEVLTELERAPIVVVRGAPEWAQQTSGATCGPIKPDALDDFAAFMREPVERYSRPPFNVQYWEIGNEPDVAPSLVPANSPYGCWGDENAPDYGGGYYTEMLKQVYPAVKEANPDARLLIGGLLLDCDPAQPPADKDCKPAQFLEGILQNGGGEYFDIISYHAYAYWNPQRQDWDQQTPAWSHRGGALLGKLDFLREVQARHNVDHPIINTEAGLLCYPGTSGCPGDDFFAAQANYLVRTYTRAWANGLIGAIWYTLNGPGWRDAGLLDQEQAPRPAYQALSFMAMLLQDAQYSGPVAQDSLEGYAFRTPTTTYHVYWTNDDATRTVFVPEGIRAIYDTTGQTILSDGSNVTATFEPVFVEIGTP